MPPRTNQLSNSDAVLENKGERLVPGYSGPDMEAEHIVRYSYALHYARGLTVLDCASGMGYGSALLATVAKKVIGVDSAAAVTAEAKRRYSRRNTEFLVGDAQALALKAGAIDLAVCFETIEHVFDPRALLAEIRRVLTPNGTLFVSTPNIQLYGGGNHSGNPFHVHEFEPSEFESTLQEFFPSVQILSQRRRSVVTIGGDTSEVFDDREDDYGSPADLFASAEYLIAVCGAAAVRLHRATRIYQSDQGALLQEAWSSLASKEQEVQNAWRLVEQRDSQLKEQWDQLAARDNDLASTGAQLSERNERLQSAWATLQERDRELQTAWTEVKKRDQQLQQAWSSASEREDQRDEAWATVQKRDAELQKAWSVVKERDGEFQRASEICAELRQQIEARESDLSQANERAAVLRSFADQGEVYRRELQTLQSTLTFRIARGLIWPTLDRLRFSFRLGHSQPRRHIEPDRAKPLVFDFETDLSKPVALGKAGSIMVVRGWCYHPDRQIRTLAIRVSGTAQPVKVYPLPREDVLREQTQLSDNRGNSLNSGFIATISLPPTPGPVILALEATLEDGTLCRGESRTIETLSFSRNPIPHAANSGPGPLVAICMTTFNPPMDLFERQLESLVKQTHTNWVCLIADDSSDEAAYRRIRKLTSDDQRFYVYRNKVRLGFYNNFEGCVAKVPENAEFVACCDQDDYWYAEKLSRCLEAFQPATQLAYSDMDIVADDGSVTSHTYWTTRRNNFRSLACLLFANTVPGAASIFRAGLLEEVLPFPEAIGDSFHDHWIACSALAKGTIAYVDQSLYAYHQHAGNVLGHYAPAATRLFPPASTLVGLGRSLRSVRTRMGSKLWPLQLIYLNDVLRLSLIAETLLQRIRPVDRGKRFILNRFARVTDSLLDLCGLALLSWVQRHPTVGAQWYCLHGVIGHRLLQLYYRRSQARAFQTARSQLPLFASHVVENSETPGSAAPVDSLGSVEVIRQKIAPLRLAPDKTRKRVVNLLVPTIDFQYFFGGYIAKFNLALQLQRHGYAVRLVVLDYCDYAPHLWRQKIARYPGLVGFFDKVEVAYQFDRTNALPVHPRDTFIATTWWTAHVAHAAVSELRQERFVYLIQEYEPMTFPMGSYYGLANQSYGFPHFAIFSTELLRDFFCSERLGVFESDVEQGKRHSVAFQNAINKFEVSEKALRKRQVRRLLFYARPEPHAARNMFELGVLALTDAVQAGAFDAADWSFDGIGSVGNFRSVKLTHGQELHLLPRVTLEEYTGLLPQYDLGLSLMLTPHPSLVPLEMASAGMVTITNTFANKTAERLRDLSSNLVPVEPTIDGVRDGLVVAAKAVEHIEARVAGSRVAWATDWDEAFRKQVIEKVQQFIA